jgi:hypothetical protein
MNKKTSDRYERVGAILAQLGQQNRLSPLGRILIDEMIASDSVFQKAFRVIRLIATAEDGKTLEELANDLGVNLESATVIVRSIKNGGFGFIESELENDTGLKGATVFELDLKPSALTYLLETTT